jgi:hypothetical protein
MMPFLRETCYIVEVPHECFQSQFESHVTLHVASKSILLKTPSATPSMVAKYVRVLVLTVPRKVIRLGQKKFYCSRYSRIPVDSTGTIVLQCMTYKDTIPVRDYQVQLHKTLLGVVARHEWECTTYD